jgi:predicted ester cyclase
MIQSVRAPQLGEPPAFGLPATGNSVHFSGITTYRVEDELITEIWEGYDRLPLLQQLGLMPAPA